MRQSLPEIRVRIQHPDEPDAYSWWDFDTEDATEILAGRRFPYVVEVVDEAGQLLGDVSNLVAGPGIEGTYRSPWGIPDAAVAYYAVDCWTYACGIGTGTLFRFLSGIYRVISPEHIDQDYSVGYATGFLICQETGGLSPMRICIEHAIDRVLELTAPKCSAIHCNAWATHVLETANPYYQAGFRMVGEPTRREPMCEPCGRSELDSNSAKYRKPTLTKETV
ncbi:hypothetical protein FE633_17555 [Streptomyces montanus]|uniref:Uncharacterized protein n=1 Tax=Streptomyces montanus TaxID=2580423 RepID=A0A5R9FUB5_9ACTN|nr:hypothetical protein [Streptomyces montanus]TLS44948.1 hypothetical protein FE633_17555 [Streptomyces montanus]